MAITLDGTTGITTPGLTNTGTETIVNLTTTGNTILGDASTDTLNVGNGGLIKDASGNVGIGTASPTAKLTVNGNQSFAEKTAAYIGVDIATTAGNGGNLTVKAGNGSGSGNTSGNLYVGAGRGSVSAANGFIAFGAAQTTNAVGLDAEYMRIDSAGNVGIGTTSPAVRLEPSSTTAAVYTRNSWIASNTDNGEVERGGFEFSTRNISGSTRTWGVYGYTTDLSTTFRGGLTFKTVNNTASESMKLTPLGNLELTTGHYYGLFTGTDVGIELKPSHGTSGAVFASFLNHTGTRIGSISRNTTTNAVLYNTTSDERLKENIADSNPVLETISKIKVRQYDWKDANVHQDYGFIAQELDTVIDGVVTKPDDAELMWSVDYSKITPHLVKAIQEQQAMIDELKAKVAALEAA